MRIYDMRKESIFNRGGAQWEERKKMAKLKKNKRSKKQYHPNAVW